MGFDCPTIKSWNLQAQLSQWQSNALEGFAVALSADGNTLVLGTPKIIIGQGALKSMNDSGKHGHVGLS